MDRPAFQQLMTDVESGKVDCIAIYKIDRLSRSLLDFARIMEVLERNNVSLVSVTQQFNTTTSMGRLTLNILLSFAQFEREIISERTRDKIAASRRKGKWAGGHQVLGYDLKQNPGGNCLHVSPNESYQVQQIFKIYLETGSIIDTLRTLREKKITNRSIPLDGPAADIDSAFGQGKFFEKLCLRIPTGTHQRRCNILGTNIPLRKLLFV